MKIYNTLSGKKQEFIPLNANKVNMYACGITVSGEAHIGHAYQALIYDIIRKYLEKIGYEVTYARNYTDVDDKIIAKSNQTGIPADEYALQMIKNIDEQMSRLDVGEPTIWIKATECIGDIIDFVAKLIEKGHAYPTDKGDVYFSVDSFPSYGRLSHRNLEDAMNGVRVDNDEMKKNPLDFALWKSAKEGEPFWNSPWGKGRPGWHIECSAMNRKTFGDRIDIHGGGRDLIFPHHENEIAQTEALTGKQFVSYWIHNGLIKVNGQKMSKSLGNSLLLKDLLDKYSAETIKLALLQTNYRGDINVTDNLFPEAQKHLLDFYGVFASAIKSNIEIFGENETIDKEFNACMDDDFNTALAISNLYGYFKKIKSKINQGDKTAGADLNQIKKTYSLLGLFKANAIEFIQKYQVKESANVDIPKEVIDIAEERLVARKNKDWAKSDELRDKLSSMGYVIKDSKDGYTLEKTEKTEKKTQIDKENHKELANIKTDRNARFSKKIINLADQRLKAIQNNDWLTADMLSAKINKLGCIIIDSPNNYVLIGLPKQQEGKEVIFPKYIIELADVVAMARYNKAIETEKYYTNLLKEKGFTINICKDGSYTLNGNTKDFEVQFDTIKEQDKKSKNDFPVYVIELADLVFSARKEKDQAKEKEFAEKLDKMGYVVIDGENDYVIKIK